MLSDTLHLATSPSNNKNSPTPVLVYFISGNPGLIEYYRPFFTHLLKSLQSNPETSGRDFVLRGESLAGFEVGTSLPKFDFRKRLPLTLREQIEDVQSRIVSAAGKLRHEAGLEVGSGEYARGSAKVSVVLIGHSVGAYILLEILKRRQHAQRHPSDGAQDSGEDGYEIVGGINLFPTIVHIEKSRNGRVATPLTALPGFPYSVHLLSRLLRLIPAGIFSGIIRAFSKEPEQVLTAFTGWLRSPYGVYSAAYLANLEMQQIGPDLYDELLWSGVHDSSSNSKDKSHLDTPSLYFYFGAQDPWVNNEIRDALITKRARRFEKPRAGNGSGSGNGKAKEEVDGEDGKPWMETDRLGIPHAFCLVHNEPIAEKTARYIAEIVTTRLQ